MHYANTYLERPVVGDLENVAQEGTTNIKTLQVPVTWILVTW